MDVISFVRPITALRSITQQTLDAPRQMLQAMSRKLDSLASAAITRLGSPTPRAAAATLPQRPTPPPPPPSGKNCLQNPPQPREASPRGPAPLGQAGSLSEDFFPRGRLGCMTDDSLADPRRPAKTNTQRPRHTDGRAAAAPSTTPSAPDPCTPLTPRPPAPPRHRCLADDTTTRLSNQINSVSVNSSKTRSQSRHRVLSAASCVPVIKYLAYPRGGGADHPKRTHGGRRKRDERMRG